MPRTPLSNLNYCFQQLVMVDSFVRTIIYRLKCYLLIICRLDSENVEGNYTPLGMGVLIKILNANCD